MINIEPVVIPTKGTATKLEIRVLTFGLNSTSATTYWSLLTDTNQVVLDGNLVIPSEVFLNWGTDDSIIEDYVIDELNLVKIIEE